MNVREFKRKCVAEVSEILSDYGSMLSVRSDEVFDHEDGEFVNGSVVVNFKYGNLSRETVVNLGWDCDDGFGLMDNECESIYPLNGKTLFADLYFSLAFEGLEDKYLM